MQTKTLVPVLRSAIAGTGIIVANFNRAEADDLVRILRQGALPALPILVRQTPLHVESAGASEQRPSRRLTRRSRPPLAERAREARVAEELAIGQRLQECDEGLLFAAAEVHATG